MNANAASTRFGWLLWLLASGSVIALAAALQYQPPRTIVVPLINFPLPQTCSAQRFLGIDCPGCGLTRSFVLAADGDLRAAFAMHPVGTILFALLVVQIPWRFWQGWQLWHYGRTWRSGRVELALAAVLTAATFLWWILVQAGVIGSG